MSSMSTSSGELGSLTLVLHGYSGNMENAGPIAYFADGYLANQGVVSSDSYQSRLHNINYDGD